MCCCPAAHEFAGRRRVERRSPAGGGAVGQPMVNSEKDTTITTYCIERRIGTHCGVEGYAIKRIYTRIPTSASC